MSGLSQHLGQSIDHIKNKGNEFIDDLGESVINAQAIFHEMSVNISHVSNEVFSQVVKVTDQSAIFLLDKTADGLEQLSKIIRGNLKGGEKP